MGERLTPRGKKLLQQKEVDLNLKLKDDTLDYGKAAGFGDGDGYHDETANLLEGEVRKTSVLLYAVTILLRSSEELKPPEQFDIIELGHRVRLELPDDKEVTGLAHVTVLSPGDIEVLFGEFDQKFEIIASNRSSLGSALLGKKVGDEVIYGKNRAFVRSIGKAGVFQDEK